MTSQQANRIKIFAQKFYSKTGKYHAWDHIQMVLYWAKKLARKQKNVNSFVLEAAVYLHDIGRSIRDQDHPKESSKIARPFLEKLGIPELEIEIILDAVEHHDKDEICKAKSIEAKLLFDADKLQIVSFFGFIRCLFWLVEERGMTMNKAMVFLVKYIQDVNNHYLQTEDAKKVSEQEYPKIETFMNELHDWENLKTS